MKKINIVESANEIIAKLIDNGYETYAVGGCVRDSLLGKIPNDWDICTIATTSEIEELFKDNEIINVGKKYGTLGIMNHGKLFEITTFRLEGKYEDYRHPDSIEFTKNVEEDLLRRDFTINAMGYNDQYGLIDINGGIDDIDDRLIRCVGNPNLRFREDSLRILRALRFAAVLNFEIEENTGKAIIEEKDGLKHISSERIRSEIDKFIVNKNATNIITEYKEVFFVIFPEFRATDGFDHKNYHHKYDVFQHTLVTLENCDKDLVLKLAALFHDISKPKTFSLDEDGVGHFFGHANLSAIMAKDILTRLKYDNHTIEKVEILIKYHDMVIEKDFKFIKRWLGKLGVVTFKKLLRLKRADDLAKVDHLASDKLKDLDEISKMIDQIQWEEQCFSIKNLKLNGDDLIKMGFPQSKKIGVMLSILLEAVISESVENKREALLEYINMHFGNNMQ